MMALKQLGRTKTGLPFIFLVLFCTLFYRYRYKVCIALTSFFETSFFKCSVAISIA